jgi:hypothetical protein
VLQARTLRDQQVWISGGALPEGIKHRGLPDAGLAGEERDRALAGLGAREPLFELREHAVPADQCAACHRRGRHPWRTGARSDEAVAPARHGLDEARGRRVVAQGPPDLEDTHLEHTVGDMGIRPRGPEQLRLRDELPALLHQAAQDRERLGGEWDNFAVAYEVLVGEVQGEALERQASICVHRRAG